MVFILGLEVDEEPAEVEVKPILRSMANISVFVEPPSSEENSSQTVRASIEPTQAEEDEAAIEQLGERYVEGAEEPVSGTASSTEQRGTF